MKTLRSFFFGVCLAPSSLLAQVGQEAGIGVFTGMAVLDHVRTSDDYKGFYHPDRSKAYYGGISIYQPIKPFLGAGLEIGFLQNTRDYYYTTDQIATIVYSDVTYYAVLFSPSLTINPKAGKGLFLRGGLPISIAAGNTGTYKLVHSDFINPPVTTDYSSQVEDYRTRFYARAEVSIGYLFTWKNGNGIWLRGSVGRSTSRFWRTSFRDTPEQPRLTHVGMEIGFRFGTPGLRLFKSAYKQADPAKPTAKQRMKDQPWINQ